jgi:hypothetical protein
MSQWQYIMLFIEINRYKIYQIQLKKVAKYKLFKIS